MQTKYTERTLRDHLQYGNLRKISLKKKIKSPLRHEHKTLNLCFYRRQTYNILYPLKREMDRESEWHFKTFSFYTCDGIPDCPKNEREKETIQVFLLRICGE